MLSLISPLNPFDFLPSCCYSSVVQRRRTHNGEVLEILGGVATNFCQKVVPLKSGFPHSVGKQMMELKTETGEDYVS